MGVMTRGRRKIIVNDRCYVWYIELDYGSVYHVLNIVSIDKSLIISCPLKTKKPYIISKGNTFQNQKTDGVWNRYLLPFHVPEIVTPEFVSKVILWSIQDGNAARISWNGKDIVL